MIKVLDKQVADKIAAGEVIERPVSIVKELVENALDAGARSISVEIKNGGKSYIRVTDDGSGIEADEVKTAFLRHATSKISKASDLDALTSLGFRGEALASICAVTKIELITKTADAKTGTRLVMHGGDVISEGATGCPDGTTIIASDLFYNTPARLKFMKSDASEASAIIEFMSQIALCYIDIKFRVINNGKIVFSTPGDSNRLNTILRIYRDVDAMNMVPLAYSSAESGREGVTIEGYISTPAFSRPTRSGQIFFVNGRVVNSKVIEKGINLGYKERLFDGRFPLCYLFLSVDPATIDVNIHPNKKEVRFDNESLISKFVSVAIKDALASKEAVVDAGNLFKNKSKMPEDTGVQESIETFNASKAPEFQGFSESEKCSTSSNFKAESNYNTDNSDIFKKERSLSASKVYEKLFSDASKVAENNINDKYLSSTYANSASIKDLEEENVASAPVEEPHTSPLIETTSSLIEKPKTTPFDITKITLTGIIFDTYITAVDESNFYMIDQHAAHERVFYEKLTTAYESSDKVSQTLLVPLIINVSLSAQATSDTWIEPLRRMGFAIEEFGPATYKIPEIPMFMELSEAEDFLNTFIDNVGRGTDLRNTVVINKLITMSCKAAIKGGDKITMDEANALLKDLSRCINPFSCPHGRPTFIKLSHYEIEKMFKRV